jgi:hypothetical protein
VSDDLVYFIRHPSGLIKVGHSAQVDIRLQTLCSVEGTKLELLGTVAGGRKREQRLHKAMAAFRVRGEWFNPNTLIDALLESAAAPNDRRPGRRDAPELGLQGAEERD